MAKISYKQIPKKNSANFFKETLLYCLVFPAMVSSIIITFQFFDYVSLTDFILGFLPVNSAALSILIVAVTVGIPMAALFVGIKNGSNHCSNASRDEKKPLLSDVNDNLNNQKNTYSTKEILCGLASGAINGYNWSLFTNLIVTLILVRILIEDHPDSTTEQLEQAEDFINKVADSLMGLFAAMGYFYGYNLHGPNKETVGQKITGPIRDPFNLLAQLCKKPHFNSAPSIRDSQLIVNSTNANDEIKHPEIEIEVLTYHSKEQKF